MKEYRKKPVVIKAIQFDGTMTGSVDVLTHMSSTGAFFEGSLGMEAGVLKIPTLEGVMTANAGDWVIQGIKGEFYPCKPDIFEATYEEVVRRDATEHFDGGRLG